MRFETAASLGMDAEDIFSPSTPSTRKKRPRTPSSSAQVKKTKTTITGAPKRSEKEKVYQPGQDLLDIDAVPLELNSDDGGEFSSEDEGVHFNSTSFGTPNVGYRNMGTAFKDLASTPLSRPRANDSDMCRLFSMIQQQQATMIRHGEMLQETLRNQQDQSAQIKSLKSNITDLKNKYEAVSTKISEAVPPKKKVRVTRDISVSI